MKLSASAVVVGTLLSTLFSQTSFAWNQHQTLMPLILENSTPALKQTLFRSGSIPCGTDDQAIIRQLISSLQLNPQSRFHPTAPSTGKCGPTSQISALDVLVSSAVDDPDNGMDQNLSPAAESVFDPSGDRKWMGGVQGPSSQGFRHMYFGGWKVTQPLATFQIPARALGLAPQRTQLIAEKARELLKSGQVAWGARLTAWAIHYIQDLTQPFHSVQLVSLKLVPWYEMLTLHPSQGFQKLVQETTRIVTNYHWAYEGYTQDRLQMGNDSPFKECLSNPEKYATLKVKSAHPTPFELSHAVSQASIQLASTVGSSELDFFGGHLLETGVDFTADPNMINYKDYATRPDLLAARMQLHEVTCKALANASIASRLLIEWVFAP
jgi:hypothetical protein